MSDLKSYRQILSDVTNIPMGMINTHKHIKAAEAAAKEYAGQVLKEYAGQILKEDYSRCLFCTHHRDEFTNNTDTCPQCFNSIKDGFELDSTKLP